MTLPCQMGYRYTSALRWQTRTYHIINWPLDTFFYRSKRRSVDNAFFPACFDLLLEQDHGVPPLPSSPPGSRLSTGWALLLAPPPQQTPSNSCQLQTSSQTHHSPHLPVLPESLCFSSPQPNSRKPMPHGGLYQPRDYDDPRLHYHAPLLP